jgi:hypothetical protein
MASFEDVDADRLLHELALELDGADLAFTDDDLRPAAMDGQRMVLDAWKGEDLRCTLVEEVVHNRQNNSNPDEQMKLLYGLSRAIHHFKTEDMMGKLLAVEGQDYVRVADSPGSGMLNAILLDGSFRLFGNIGGVGFGEYVTINPGGLSDEGTRIVVEKPIHLGGAMLLLQDAIICDASEDGYGQWRGEFPEVRVPVHANGLTWLAAKAK